MTSLQKKLMVFATAFVLLPCIFPISAQAQQSVSVQQELVDQVHASLIKGLVFFHSLNTEGGYVYYVTPDLSMRWGESPADTHTIEVQPPGTPAVGQSFLRAYEVTSDNRALAFAKEAAHALIRGQNKHGGWDHTIDFNNLDNEVVSFDDDQSQSAVSFLMALDQLLDDPVLTAATQKALQMMLKTQLGNGGWPHKYPEQGNYHDYATFNDGGINDCIRVMLEAYRYYPEDKAIEQSLRKAARFLMISQLPPPQPGWAQQYNEFLQPAWARTFEPPAVCPSVTVKNINTLIDLYLILGNETLLEPIPDALRWLREVRMENGMWARFVELGTNKALYYDRRRIRVDKLEELHPERRTGYAYQTDLQVPLEKSTLRYEKALEMGNEALWEAEQYLDSKDALMRRITEITRDVVRILEEQEASGAWITKNDRFKKNMPRGERWNGQYLTMDRISSSVFNKNVATLCEFLELNDQLEEFAEKAN